MTVKNTTTPPPRIKDMLMDLSTVPQRIQELKKSTAHAQAGLALARAKDFLLEMESAKMAGGLPKFNADGIEFS